MKIIFMGTPDYATSILKKLINDDSFDLIALFAQPDKKVGRKQIMTPPDTKQFILKQELAIKIFQPNRLREQENIDIIKELQPDFIVVAAYGQILPKEILQIAPCINLHASLLPKYRGASPIQSSILNQDNKTGITAMLMDEGLDTGSILGFRYIDIDINNNAIELFEKLSDEAGNLLIDVLKNFHKLNPIEQNSSISNYAKKIKKDDGLIDSDSSASEIYAKFNAFILWPEIYLESGLKLKEIKLIDRESKGEFCKILDIKNSSIIIETLCGKIEVFKVQPQSKKEMDILSYLRGKRLQIGDYLS